MLVWTIFSLFKVNQERVNNYLYRCSVQAHKQMVFYYSTVDCKKGDKTYYLDFALACDIGFEMMPKVKVTETSKIQSVLQDFPEEFMKSSNNEIYSKCCGYTVSCNKHFLV